jgi:hypothetical protein
MQPPSDPNQENVVALSDALVNRREAEHTDISRDDLKSLLSEVINEQLTEKFTRLQKSIDLMMVHIGAVQSGEIEDSALKVTTDLNAPTDLALATVQLRPEDYYTYTTGDIADALGVNIHKVSKLSDSLGLRNNSQYHKAIKTGKVGRVQKYSQDTFDKIKEAIELGNS